MTIFIPKFLQNENVYKDMSMRSFENFVCSHPYFSMLIFASIGILLKSIRRMNLTAIKFNLEDLELALNDKDLEKANYYLQRLKSGFGF